MILINWISLAALVASQGIIGVKPEDQHLYKVENGKWACLLDPSIVLDSSQINDDICDCPDGSDEPGTAACSHLRGKSNGFYCANEGYFPGYIENFKVNDGVCDYDICCDGSDEWATGKCPNKCEIVKQKFDTYVENRKAEISKALRIRDQYVRKAERYKAAVVKNLENIQGEITGIEKQLENEKKKLADAKSRAEQSSEDESTTKQFSELTTQLQNYIKDSIASQKRSLSTISKLESLLNDLAENYNPNYNDASVKQCVNQFREYITGKQEEEEKKSDFSIELFTEKLKSFKPSSFNPQDYISIEPTFDNMVHHYFMKFVNTFKPKANEEEEKPNHPQAAVTNKEIVAIEKSIEKLEKELHSKKAEASIYEENVLKVFGNDDILRAVEGEWVNRKIGEYNYKIGYLDSIYQDNTLVGRLTGVVGSTLHFEHGVKCWNGPHRSAHVDMVCAADSRIVSVSEPEKCQYRFLLETPIVCEDMSEEQIAREFKVDPSEL